MADTPDFSNTYGVPLVVEDRMPEAYWEGGYTCYQPDPAATVCCAGVCANSLEGQAAKISATSYVLMDHANIISLCPEYYPPPSTYCYGTVWNATGALEIYVKYGCRITIKIWGYFPIGRCEGGIPPAGDYFTYRDTYSNATLVVAYTKDSNTGQAVISPTCYTSYSAGSSDTCCDTYTVSRSFNVCNVRAPEYTSDYACTTEYREIDYTYTCDNPCGTVLRASVYAAAVINGYLDSPCLLCAPDFAAYLDIISVEGECNEVEGLAIAGAPYNPWSNIVPT